MAAKSITVTKDDLHNTFWKHLSGPAIHTRVIGNIINLFRESNITIPAIPFSTSLPTSTLISYSSISFLDKNKTYSSCFKKMLIEKSHNFHPICYYIPMAHRFRNGTCSYSIVKEINGTQFELICENRLPDSVGIFFAEISAIKDAISYSVKKRKRSIIFS